MTDIPETDTPDATIPLETLVSVFLKMRDRYTTLDKEVKNIDLQMKKIKLAINDRLREAGLEGAKTAAGRVHRTIRTTYTTADWSSMHQFIIEHGVPELLEKRLHQGNMAQFLSSNPGVEMPGLNAITEYSVTVTRNKS